MTPAIIEDDYRVVSERTQAWCLKLCRCSAASCKGQRSNDYISVDQFANRYILQFVNFNGGIPRALENAKLSPPEVQEVSE